MMTSHGQVVVTANGEKLKDKALVIRVFGYHTHTQLDIDSFLNFLNLVDLKVSKMKSSHILCMWLLQRGCIFYSSILDRVAVGQMIADA